MVKAGHVEHNISLATGVRRHQWHTYTPQDDGHWMVEEGGIKQELDMALLLRAAGWSMLRQYCDRSGARPNCSRS